MASQGDLSQRKWWLKDPTALDESDKSFLCETCRHINFQFMLFETPQYHVPERYEIPLGTYSDVLNRQSCAFCRLVKAAIDNTKGDDDDVLPAEHDGKPVMLSMISASESHVASHPRHLLLWVKPDPQRKKGAATPPRLIQLVNQEWGVDGSGRGRPINLKQLDYPLALYWVRSCRMGYGLHEKESDSEELELRRKLPPNFRLIDVKQMRIIDADSSMQYVTLSYVWPKSQQLKLEKGNMSMMMGPDKPLARKEFRDKIPQTVKDAMELCLRIGDRYLWVDALCVIQDDDRIDGDRATQIGAMDVIYGSSTLTVVTTCGNGAEASLPGVYLGTRKIIQKTKLVQGHRLTNRPWDFAKSVTESKWNTRAWTFQERILSKRKLFITPQMMFFQCVHTPSRMQEDLDVAPEARKRVTYPMNDTGTDQIPINGNINISTYIKTVENFTSRQITKKCDILNAFRGIEAKMKPIFRSGFLHGLPQSELDYCLMWEPVGEMKRRICPNVKCNNPGCPNPDSLEPIFPSWSWAGWEGPVTYNLRERLSRVRWVERGPKPGSTEQMFTSNEYRAPSSKDISISVSEWWNEWQQGISNWDSRFFYHPSDPNVWFRNPTAPESRPGPNCDPDNNQYLRFEAQTQDVKMPKEWNSQSTTILHAQMLATMPVSEPHMGYTAQGTTTPYMPPTWDFGLKNDDGRTMGYFRVPTQLANEMSFEKKYTFVRIARVSHSLTPEQIRERKDGSKNARPLPGPVMSVQNGLLEHLEGDCDVSAEAASFPDEVSTEEAKEYLPFDRQQYDAYKPFCMYEFLVVERVGNVAFRIGMGMVHVDAWAQEKPKTEIVVLA